MAKASKKKVKKKTSHFYGFNIKLFSDTRSEDAYLDLIRTVFNVPSLVKISKEKAMALRSQNVVEYTFNGKKHKVAYGKLIRFTVLSDDDWYDSTTKELKRFDLPGNTHPNSQEVDYIFIPATHRFYFTASSKISITATEAFLHKAISTKGIQNGEDYGIYLIQSQDTITQIINSPVLKSLKVKVSYTNDDIGDEAFELIDQFLKDAQVGETESTFRPDQHGTLNTESSLIRGYLEVARENGAAEASVINEAGRREKIVTTNYPDKRKVEYTESDNLPRNLFDDVMTEYRNEQPNS
ncbi:MAG: DUF4747 family protein [Bacteroidota bacterium]